MKPAAHIAISTGLGAGVATFTGSPWAFATTLGTGILVDADHVLDYYRWYVRHKIHRVFYLLHAWEHLAILVAISALSDWHPLLIGTTLGYLSHLIADQLGNDPYPLSYSIIYRAIHGFNISRVSPWRVNGTLEELATSLQDLPFGKRLAPRLTFLLRHVAPEWAFASQRQDQDIFK